MRTVATTLGLIAGGALAAAAMTIADRVPAKAGITVVPGAAPAPPRPVPGPAAAPTEAAPARRMAAASTWWRPAVSDTWRWQLSGRINTGYDVAVYRRDAQARAALCRASQIARIRTLVLPLNLDGKFRFSCD